MFFGEAVKTWITGTSPVMTSEAMSGKTLFTIGYQQALPGDIIATLTAAGVKTLLDVRDRPISRREWERFWGIVQEKLARPEAELDLLQAAAIAEAAPSCLLCYEADWQVCHRRRIAEILAKRRGFDIRHLDAIA